MKLIVQIPCLNEAETLPGVLKAIPNSIPGITSIETLVVDDGSTDGTSEVAHAAGVKHIIRHPRNLGLASSFRTGIDYALGLGADVIVNIDGDLQHNPAEIPKLVEPVRHGTADIVVGNRGTSELSYLSAQKKFLEWFGSFIVRRLSSSQISDAVCGFRAFSRNAAFKITILGNYTYTIESLLQARAKGLRVVEVPISCARAPRDSRLIKSLMHYLAFSSVTIVRIFTMYNPLRVFLAIGSPLIITGFFLVTRYLYLYVNYGPQGGRVQSLLLAAVLAILGFGVILAGIIADLVQFNRRLLEDILERVRRAQLDQTKGDHEGH